MGCGSGNFGGASNLGHVASEVLAFLGSLAAQIAALMASGSDATELLISDRSAFTGSSPLR